MPSPCPSWPLPLVPIRPRDSIPTCYYFLPVPNNRSVVVFLLFPHTKLQSQFLCFSCFESISSSSRSAMEVSIINRMSDFGGGISRLHSRSAVKAAAGFRTLWTWGAVILAIVAAFSSLIRRVKLLLLLRVPAPESLIPQSFIQSSFSSSSSDYDDDASSSCSSSDGVEPDDEREDVNFSMPSASSEATEMDFRVAGSGDGLFSKSVVKLWDGLGLGADRLASSTVVWDMNLAEKVRSFSAGWSSHVLGLCSPSPVVAAGAGEDHFRVALKVWDARVGSRSSAVVSEWSTPGSEVLGIGAGGVEQVYMGDAWQKLTVRDLGKVGAPLPEEAEEMDWYDAVAMFDANPPAAIDGRGRGSGPVQRRRRHC